GGRRCPTRQPVTPHRAANTHSPNKRSNDGSSPLPRTVPASVLFPCDTFPRLLLSAAAFTSPSRTWMSSLFCPSVPPTVSPLAPECAPNSVVIVVPSCNMVSAVGAFVSAVAEVPTDGCCVPSPCTVSPASASTV
ncbi:exo-alpha-sialidase, partial [Trypanosoma cruzi]